MKRIICLMIMTFAALSVLRALPQNTPPVRGEDAYTDLTDATQFSQDPFASLTDTLMYPLATAATNHAPVFSDTLLTLTLEEDGRIEIYRDSLLALASDPDSADTLNLFPYGETAALIDDDSVYVYRPEKDWHGDDSLRFVVSDGELSDTLRVRLRVESVNDAPQWTAIDPFEFPEDEFAQLPLDILYEHAADIETPDSLLRFYLYSGDHVAISAEGGRITLIADENWFGEDKVLLEVSDGDLSDTLHWTIRVTAVNDPPELAPLPDTLFYEDGSIYIDKHELEKYAFDVETSPRDLKWQVKRFGKIRAFYNGREIRMTASRNWFGTDSLELTVSDGELSASRIWRVHVLPVNDPPRWKKRIKGRSFLEDDTLRIAKKDLYELVYDPETEVSALTWSLMPPEQLHILEHEEYYDIYANPHWFGKTAVRIAVHDGELGDTIFYPLRVLSVNDKPQMRDLEARSWNEDDTLSIDRAYLLRYASDVETPEKDLMWSFIDDRHLKVKKRSDAITLVPDPDWYGDARIGLIVYDGGLRDTGYMEIRINPVNDAPRWTPLPDTSMVEDGFLVLPLDFIRSFISDPDKDDKIDLSYEAGDNFYIEEKTDTLEIWPTPDWYGTETLKFSASDGKEKVTYTWKIPVMPVNDPPYFTMALPDSISFKANSSDTLLFEDIVYDIDNDLSDLTWEITPGRHVRYTINDNINQAKREKDKKAGIIFYTENYKSGEDAVTIRVTDGHDMIVYYLPVFVREVDRFLIANPEKLTLLPNTPNPFREFTDIRYSLPVSAQVNIKVYNLLGKEIKELVNEYQDAQNYSVRWWGETESGMPAPSGVYLCRMVTMIDGEPMIMMQKMMLVR